MVVLQMDGLINKEDAIMKKIYSFALLAAAALSVLSSCKKESFLSEEDLVAGNGPTSFVAYLDEDATKTTIDGFKVKWNDGDEISVNGKIYVAAVDALNPSKAEFTLKEGETAPTGSTLRAYYPTSAFCSTTYTQRYKLQGTQVYNGDDLSTISYMYAQCGSTDYELHFKNVCGLLALDLTGEEAVTQIKVTAPSSNYLYGTFSNFAYNATTGAVTYSSFVTSGRGTSVYLDCGKGVQLSKTEAKRFYIALPEKSYASLKVEITTPGGVKTLNSTKACNIVKNKIYNLTKEVSFPVLEFEAEVAVSNIETVSAAAAHATLNVTPKDNDVYYVYALESPGYVNQFSTPLELAKADLDFWKSQGATSLSMLINAGLAVKGPHSETYNSLSPNSQYVPYAYAIDADFNISPAVIGAPFTTPEYVRPTISAKYEDYLGQWVFGTSVVTVEQKVAGESYSISGLPYQSYSSFGYEFAPVEAKFDEGYFVVNEQKTGTVIPVGSYGDCDIVLSGEFAQGTSKFIYYPFNGDTPQTIFTGAFDGNKTIKVEAGACEYGAFVGFCFAWVIQSGANAGKGNYFTTSNLSDWTKYQEVTGPTPEGDWFCASVTDYWGEDTFTNWTMNIEQSGVGYKINNFDQGFDEFLETYRLRSRAPVAVWDAEAKTLTIATGTGTGISDGTNLFYWTGLDGETEVDIVLAFDFDNKTDCALGCIPAGCYRA